MKVLIKILSVTVFFVNYLHPAYSCTAHCVITPYTCNHEIKVNSNSVSKISLTFIDKLSFFLDPDMTWKLFDENHNLIMNGKGAISQLLIGVPGDYTIDLIQPKKFGEYLYSDPSNHANCNHDPFPDKIAVFVSPIHLKFDFTSIRFSQPLSSVHLKNVKLDIEAWFEHYKEPDFVIPVLKISSVGIEAKVEGTLVQQYKSSKTGKIHLTYHLNGSLKKGSYIMLNFHDANNLIQSYAHLTMIN